VAEIEPLSAEEILFVRKIYRRRQWFSKALYGALGTAIGGAIIAWLMT